MSKHSEIGKKGEQIAADFLLNKGYIILHRNWRTGRMEIDVIAATGDMAVIVEIKTRSSHRLHFPEEAVTARKQQLLRQAAQAFAADNPAYKHIRFDIVSVLMDKGAVKEVVHFEEAFH